MPRKTAQFTDQQVRQLAAYVQSVGGGPAIPAGSVEGTNSDLGLGGELFRLNCASCHGTTFKGAPLSAGKIAPSLNKAPAMQIYTAMETGPESMPIFSDNQITPAQKRAIVKYIMTIKQSQDPGGSRHRQDRPGVRGDRHLGRRYRGGHDRDALDRSQDPMSRRVRSEAAQ